MAKVMTSTERITYRATACNCGCSGSDPWHRREYRRVVSNATPMNGECKTRDMGTLKYKQVGWVRLPMSTRPVRVCDANTYTASARWVVDYDSIHFDKW